MSATAQPLSGAGKMVGDYLVGGQIGSGSFSVVWHGRHRVYGTEVAIKEISTSRLNKKLKDSLMSEIFILKRINHPHIICLHDIIEVPGIINIVLEYCKGGDLSMYLQRHGKVSEPVARNFMKQLAAGLQVLRDNNLIHRDLKPQNLLLSTSGKESVLKIADFGFARPLHPRGLAETLCGSPLYMAPEIMQLQKYDAKADLWSVGAILFQLITGRTPFTGNNQIQLLQNILKSNELIFPPDCRDLSSECKDLCQKLLRRNPVERLTFDEFFNHPFFSQRNVDPAMSDTFSGTFHGDFGISESTHEENTAEDCLPFILDDIKKLSNPILTPLDIPTKKSAREIVHELKSPADDQRLLKVMDSTEMVDGYVIVSSPPSDPSSSSSSFRLKSKKSPKQKSALSAVDHPPLGCGSITRDTVEIREGDRPPLDGMGRFKWLQECSSALADIVREKIGGGKQLGAFAVQLVILAMWKQELSIRHASAIGGAVSGESMCSEEVIEGEFMREVEYAEELARGIEPGGSEMPDAMEMIFQCALALGRNGGVDELMGNGENAMLQYERAAKLMLFLLEEGPSLIISPPFSLTTSDRNRLKSYIYILTNRRFRFLEESPP